MTITRGRLFDTIADLYDEVRPPYPEGFFAAIEAMTGPLQGQRVLDLAAGTGLVTRTLLRRGADVVAVDPGEPMISRLSRTSPGALAVVARAEQLPFSAATFDVVVCATAWHWVDADLAVAEVSRVLRPGGHLALLWANHMNDARIAWERAQHDVYREWEVRAGSRPPGIVGVGPRDAARHLRRRGLTVVSDTELRWVRQVPTSVHLQVLATHSDVLALGDAKEEFLAEVAAALAPWETVDERLWGPLVIARIG
jgi:SAM-dependent methyltransferase